MRLRTRNERKEEQGFCEEKEDGLAEKTEVLLFQNGKKHFLRICILHPQYFTCF